MAILTKLFAGILEGVSYFYINFLDFLNLGLVEEQKSSPYFDQFFNKLSEDSDISELTYVKMCIDEDSSDKSY